MQTRIRAFHLHRLLDDSRTSGVGVVAEGVVFRDGTVALRWFGDHPSTGLYQCLADVVRIHGHSGHTLVEMDT